MADMTDILDLLHSQYDHPVDIEYTVNFSPEGEYVIDLLQCRPLTQTAAGEAVTLPPPDQRCRTILETKGVSMGFSRCFDVDVLVYVDAIAYYRMPYADKYKVRTALSRINWFYRGQNKRLVLITPGRIGTSSPELGVPTAFSDISEFDAVVEVSETQAGYMPELSYGSHFFQDLVEAGILYSAVFGDESTVCFSPEEIRRGANALDRFDNLPADLSEIIHVAVDPKGDIKLYYDMASEHLLIAELTDESRTDENA